jgi:putative membrane protein
VRYYLGATWQAPLVVIVLVTFALGAAAGALASVAYVMRQRRELGWLLRRRIPTLPEAPSSDGTAS